MMRPSLALGLLKSELAAIGVAARVENFALAFAELIGEESYLYLSDQAPPELLAGEWVFASCLFGDDPTRTEAFERHVGTLASPAELELIRHARSKAEGFLRRCIGDGRLGRVRRCRFHDDVRPERRHDCTRAPGQGALSRERRRARGRELRGRDGASAPPLLPVRRPGLCGRGRPHLPASREHAARRRRAGGDRRCDRSQPRRQRLLEPVAAASSRPRRVAVPGLRRVLRAGRQRAPPGRGDGDGTRLLVGGQAPLHVLRDRLSGDVPLQEPGAGARRAALPSRRLRRAALRDDRRDPRHALLPATSSRASRSWRNRSPSSTRRRPTSRRRSCDCSPTLASGRSSRGSRASAAACSGSSTRE